MVVDDALFSLIIGRLEFKMMRESLKFDKEVVVFRSGESKIVFPLWTDGEPSSDRLSKKFTSNEKINTKSDDS